MTFSEAKKIFEDWQNYIEIADKLRTVFAELPESFLPHPVIVLEEALSIVAKNYFDTGDKKKANTIKETLAFYLSNYKKDENGIESMNKILNLISQNPELKNSTIKNLQKCRDSWTKL